MSPTASHWEALAAAWAHVRPPLRPCPEDLAIVVRHVQQWAARSGRAPRSLILGATPELHGALAPLSAEVFAADQSEAMIRTVWPGARGRASLADWRRLPHADGALDVVCCDGGLHLLAPPGQREVALEVGRVLAPRGLLAVRLFAPPRRRESVERVLSDAAAGRISDVHVLKVRLIMALHRSRHEGVRLHDVWLAARAIERAEPASRTGGSWTEGEWASLDAYEHAERRYHVLTVDEAIGVLSNAPFTLVDQGTPNYPCGELFPTLVFERRAP